MSDKENICDGCYYAIRKYKLLDLDPKTNRLGSGLLLCRITEAAFGFDSIPIEEMRKDKGLIHCGPSGKYYWNPKKPEAKAPSVPEPPVKTGVPDTRVGESIEEHENWAVNSGNIQERAEIADEVFKMK